MQSEDLRLGDTRMLMRVPPHAALTSLFISPQCFTAIVDAFPADEAAIFSLRQPLGGQPQAFARC
jgi:hypothetical protein